jgi:hypothetical protein
LHSSKEVTANDAFWGYGEEGFEVKGVSFVLAIKAYRGRKGLVPFILNIGTCGDEELAPGSGRFIPGKNPYTRSIGVGMDVF